MTFAFLDVMLYPVHYKLNLILDKLTAIERKLGMEFKQGEQLMAGMNDIKNAISQLNDATNAEAAQLDSVQSRIDALVTQVQGGVSSEEAQTIVDSLSQISGTVASASDRLKQMAADPANPVPTPAP